MINRVQEKMSQTDRRGRVGVRGDFTYVRVFLYGCVRCGVLGVNQDTYTYTDWADRITGHISSNCSRARSCPEYIKYVRTTETVSWIRLSVAKGEKYVPDTRSLFNMEGIGHIGITFVKHGINDTWRYAGIHRRRMYRCV